MNNCNFKYSVSYFLNKQPNGRLRRQTKQNNTPKLTKDKFRLPFQLPTIIGFCVLIMLLVKALTIRILLPLRFGLHSVFL